jgi:hypothetical protein
MQTLYCGTEHHCQSVTKNFQYFKSFHVRSKICFPICEDLFLGNAYSLCKNSCLPLYHLKLRTSLSTLCIGRGRDCMVVEFTTTCAISAYHH